MESVTSQNEFKKVIFFIDMVMKKDYWQFHTFKEFISPIHYFTTN